MSNLDKAAITFLVIVWTFAVSNIGFSIGTAIARKEAMKAGVGQFVADPKTGSVQFQYKKQ